MIFDKPYFMNNPQWFYFDENEWRYKLTDKATESCKKSYAEFYANEDELIYGQR